MLHIPYCQLVCPFTAATSSWAIRDEVDLAISLQGIFLFKTLNIYREWKLCAVKTLFCLTADDVNNKKTNKQQNQKIKKGKNRTV